MRSSGGQRGLPKGLVLGLTMAETTVLMLFVLLLAMSVLLARERGLRQEAEQITLRNAALEAALTEEGLATTQARAAMAAARDLVAAERWRELVRAVGPSVPTPAPGAIYAHVGEALDALERETARAELEDAIADAGLEPTGPNLSALAEAVRATSGASLGQSDLAGTGPGGEGSDNPSCWNDSDGSVAYLFDVALVDRGFILRPALAPQHSDKRASLPLGAVQTGRVLTPGQFLDQTRPVYSWSVERECRFFVRAFDETGPTQKELYKVRMRTLEGHFYKNSNPQGPSPF